MSALQVRGFLSDALEALRTPVTIPQGPAKGGYFDICLRSTLVKALEFSLLAHSRHSKDAFFMMATLRGVCEDFIVLRYLFRFPKAQRDKLVWLLMQRQFTEAIRAQTKFFIHSRPKQWVLMNTKKETEDTLQHLATEFEKVRKKLALGPGDRLPTVKRMAVDAGLLDLYEFLYHGTSKVVHFSPHVSLRMGWGDTSKRLVTFSAKNFHRYYSNFNRFYSLYVCNLFILNFGKHIKLTKQLRSSAAILETSIENVGRWPELVTFEEMNLDLKRFQVFMPLTLKMVMAKEDYLPETASADAD